MLRKQIKSFDKIPACFKQLLIRQNFHSFFINNTKNLISSEILPQSKKSLFINNDSQNKVHYQVNKYFCKNLTDINHNQKNHNERPFINYNPEKLDKKSKYFNIIDKLPEKPQQLLKLGRYDRPIGYMLLFLPCAWGLTLSSPIIGLDYIYKMALFFSGAILMRSSGCIINDIWDRDIDKMVERSKERPLASGKISIKEASFFLCGHLAVSLMILLKLPTNSIIAGLGIMPIVCIYPYMKRITYVPQLFLGLSFNSGIIVGYYAFDGILDMNLALPFYFAGVIWTLIYDTIYAHMDKTDDLKIKVKSTAILFVDKTKYILILLNLLMAILAFYGLENYRKKDVENKKINFKNNHNEGRKGLHNTKYFFSYLSEMSFYIAFILQFKYIFNVKLNDPSSCLRGFKNSGYIGFFIYLSILFSALQKMDDKNSDKTS